MLLLQIADTWDIMMVLGTELSLSSKTKYLINKSL